MKRRQFLGVTSGALALGGCSGNEKKQRWEGIHLGIEVSISYRGDLNLEPALDLAREVESALTMWEAGSPLTWLNEMGSLKNPSKHVLRCLEKSRELFEASEGLFDPTIRSYLRWLKTEIEEGREPTQSAAEERRRLVDFNQVSFSEKEVSIPKGMSLDLNAIAQGYLTDVVAEAIEAESALVNFGEFRVVGDKPWPVQVGKKSVQLSRALAVSSGSGQRLSATSPANHLINPRSGESPVPDELFAVEADEAWLADGLATILAVGGEIPERYRDQAKRLEG